MRQIVVGSGCILLSSALDAGWLLSACRLVNFVMVYNNLPIARNGRQISREPVTTDDRGRCHERTGADQEQRTKIDTATDETPDAIDIGPLSRMIGYALRRAQIAVFEDFIASLAEVNLRPAQFSVLLVLDRAPGSTQSAVAASLGIKRANFVAMMDDLEERGLAERTVSPSDKRSHAIFLTENGRKTLDRARALAQRHEARQIAKLGDGGVEALLMLLGRLAK